MAACGCPSRISASPLTIIHSVLSEVFSYSLIMSSALKRERGFEKSDSDGPNFTSGFAHSAPGHRISIVRRSVYACASSFSTFSGVSRWEYQMPKAMRAQAAAVAGIRAHFQERDRRGGLAGSFAGETGAVEVSGAELP